MSIKISVIVPIYNVEAYIERCVRSLFEQSYSNIEYIFVDDCSPDNSLGILKTILEEYPQRKKDTLILYNEKNLGLAGTRKVGNQYATGEYVIQFDSDDWLHPLMIENACIAASKSDADVVIWGIEYVFKHRNVKQYAKHYSSHEELFRASISGEMHNSLCNKMFRRSIFTQHNIQWIEGLNMLEDSSVVPRLLYYARRVVYLDECYYFYNQLNANSYTHDISHQSAENILQVMNVLEQFLSELKVLDKYNKELSYFKLHAKLILLLRSNYSDRKQYCSLYPETTGLIGSHPYHNCIHKLLLYLAGKKHNMLVSCLVPLRNVLVATSKKIIGIG